MPGVVVEGKLPWLPSRADEAREMAEAGPRASLIIEPVGHLLGMSGDAAAKAEAIHQVDSVFGLLLVILLFSTSTVLNLRAITIFHRAAWQ